MLARHSVFKSLLLATVVAALAAPAPLHAFVAPAVLNEKAEKSHVKAIAEIKDIKAVDEKDGIETRIVTFKLEKRISDSQVPEEFVGTCQTVVKGKPKIGEALYFNPVKGARVYVTVAEKGNEITSLTTMSPRLMNALVKTPDKVKFNVGLAIVDDGADQKLDSANSLFEKKDYRQAVIDANKAIQICPTYDRAYHLRGRIFLETRKLDSAEGDFTKAIELNPNNYDAYYQRGICKNDQRRFSAAIEDFTKVLDVDPSDLLVRFCRAKAYKNNGQDDKALDDYKKIELADKNNQMVVRQIGFVYYETGDLASAEKQFARSLELLPTDMYSAIFLHIVKAKLGKPSDIAKNAEGIKDPAVWPAPVMLMFAGKLSPEKAIEDAATGKPDEQWQLSGAYFYAAQKALAEGDKAKAAALFKKCVDTKDSMGLEFNYAKKELEALSKAPSAK